MPLNFWKTPSFEERQNLLRAEIAALSPIIGGWPTAIRTDVQLRKVREQWTNAQKSATKLLQERPDALEIKLLLGDLWRIGHNIDMPNAAQNSDNYLKDVLKIQPDNARAYFLLASLYVSLSPELAPTAEQYFRKVESLAAPKVIPDVYHGLGFACLYQNNVVDAIAHFERYVTLVETSCLEVEHILAQLKAGKTFRIVHKS